MGRNIDKFSSRVRVHDLVSLSEIKHSLTVPLGKTLYGIK